MWVWGGMPELEVFQYQCLQRCNIIGIRETWRDETMPGVPHWMLTGSSGEAGRWLECMELTFGNGTVLSLWVRIKGQTNKMDVIVGVYYKPPSQDNDTDELLFEELMETSNQFPLSFGGTSTCRMLTRNDKQLVQTDPEDR